MKEKLAEAETERLGGIQRYQENKPETGVREMEKKAAMAIAIMTKNKRSSRGSRQKDDWKLRGGDRRG